MVCRECKKPLNPHSTINLDSGDEHVDHYLHAGDKVGDDGGMELHWGHEAIPVEGDPLTADVVCDFCGGSGPRYVFVPRDVVIHEAIGAKHRLFSPHMACDGCRQLVRKRDMTRLLDRAVNSPLTKAGTLPPDKQRAYRALMRGYFTSFFKTRPAGPYEIRIGPKPNPFGRRGSARGA